MENRSPGPNPTHERDYREKGLESLKAKDYEVLLMVDLIDEWVTQSLHDDISGRGQARAAHKLWSTLLAYKRRHVLQLDRKHTGLNSSHSCQDRVLTPACKIIRGQS